MAINRKISELLKEKGMTKAALAKACGVPYTTLDSMLKRSSDTARLSAVFRMAEVLGVSVEELVFDEKKEPGALTPEENRILALFGALDKRGRDTVISLLEKEAELAETAKEKKVLRAIPVFDSPAAAGAALPVLSEEQTQILVDEKKAPKEANFGIRISGDSMEPEIRSGEMVFVSRVPELLPGEIGIFLLNGESLCKRLEIRDGEVFLQSVNPAYEPLHVLDTDNLKLVGKVIR